MKFVFVSARRVTKELDEKTTSLSFLHDIALTHSKFDAFFPIAFLGALGCVKSSYVVFF